MFDPARAIPPVAVPRAMPRPAPHAVVDGGLRTVSTRTRLMIAILTLTGMRRGEVAKVHTDDLQRGMFGWKLRVIGKGGHERHVPIEDDLARTIAAMPKGFLFPGQIQGHLSAAYVGKLVSAALDGPWTAHTLRHRYASLAYGVTKDIRAVQELLGHAKITTTQIYTLVDDGSLRTAASAARIGLDAA